VSREIHILADRLSFQVTDKPKMVRTDWMKPQYPVHAPSDELKVSLIYTISDSAPDTP